MQDIIGADLTWFIVFVVISLFFLTIVFATRTFEFYGGNAPNKIMLGSAVTLFMAAAIGVFYMITVELPGFTFNIVGGEFWDLFFILFIFGFLSAMVAGLYSIHVQRGGF